MPPPTIRTSSSRSALIIMYGLRAEAMPAFPFGRSSLRATSHIEFRLAEYSKMAEQPPQQQKDENGRHTAPTQLRCTISSCQTTQNLAHRSSMRCDNSSTWGAPMHISYSIAGDGGQDGHDPGNQTAGMKRLTCNWPSQAGQPMSARSRRILEDVAMQRHASVLVSASFLALLVAAGTADAAALQNNARSRQQAAADSVRAAHVLNRLTFGSRPGDMERVLSMGIDRWI